LLDWVIYFVKKIGGELMKFLVIVALLQIFCCAINPVNCYGETSKNLTKLKLINLPQPMNAAKNNAEIKKIFADIQEDITSFQMGDIEAVIKKHVKEKQKDYKKYGYESIEAAALANKNGIFVIKYIFSIDNKAKCFFFDKDGRLVMYINGQINMDKHYKVENSNERKNTLNIPENYRIDGHGVEIVFHATGFPKSFTKIAKNRLFGRQIEWNDKGEVISDVDLDIPKEWKDAPKKSKPAWLVD
jgi:hypothetical protein